MKIHIEWEWPEGEDPEAAVYELTKSTIEPGIVNTSTALADTLFSITRLSSSSPVCVALGLAKMAGDCDVGVDHKGLVKGLREIADDIERHLPRDRPTP